MNGTRVEDLFLIFQEKVIARSFLLHVLFSSPQIKRNLHLVLAKIQLYLQIK